MKSIVILLMTFPIVLLTQVNIDDILERQLMGQKLQREELTVLDQHPEEVASLLAEKLPELHGRSKVEAFNWVEGLASSRKIGLVDDDVVVELAHLTSQELKLQIKVPENTSLRTDILHVLNKLGQRGYDDETAKSIIDTAHMYIDYQNHDSRILGVLISLVGLTQRTNALEAIRKVQNVYRYDVFPTSFGDPQGWRFAPTWNALKASARLYQSSDVDVAISRISEAGWQTATDELCYIRQPQVVDFLEGFLNREACIPYPDTGTDVLPAAPDCVVATSALIRLYPALGDAFGQFREAGEFVDDNAAAAYVKSWLSVAANRDTLRKGMMDIRPNESAEALKLVIPR